MAENNEENKFLNFLKFLSGIFWAWIVEIFFDAGKYVLIPVMVFALAFAIGYFIYCLISGLSFDSILYLPEIIESIINYAVEELTKFFPQFQKYIIPVLGAFEMIRVVFEKIKEYNANRRAGSAGSSSGNTGSSGSSNTTANSSSAPQPPSVIQYNSGQEFYHVSCAVNPVYTQIGDQNRLYRIEAKIRMANGRSQTEKLVIEGCIFFTADVFRVKRFYDEVFYIGALGEQDISLTYEVNMADEEFNRIRSKKCVLEIKGNRKLIIKKELSLI